MEQNPDSIGSNGKNTGNGTGKRNRWDIGNSNGTDKSPTTDQNKRQRFHSGPSMRQPLLGAPGTSMGLSNMHGTADANTASLASRVEALEQQMAVTTSRLNNESQYLRSNNLLFFGIPEQPNEPVSNRFATATRDVLINFVNTFMIAEIAGLLPLETIHISDCHRIKSSKTPRPIIVSFTQGSTASLLINNGKVLKNYNKTNSTMVSIRRHHDNITNNKIKYLNLCRKLVPTAFPGGKAVINDFQSEPKLKITNANNEVKEFDAINMVENITDLLGFYDPNQAYVNVE